jgi:ABC-type ATPase with predicted acetyltransferase domain
MSTQNFQIRKHFPFTHAITKRMKQLMNLFGLTLFRLEKMSFQHILDVQLRPGDICYITGPSGAGKSVLLREMYHSIPEARRIRLEDIPLETNQSLIDSIEGPIFEAVRTLNHAGLSDVFAMLQRPAVLSVGQQFRYRLARAFLSDKTYIFADEFMASLEPLTASVICRQLRDIATKTKRIFVFAGVHDHFLPDLWPDVIVVKSSRDQSRVIFKDPTRNTKSSIINNQLQK